MSPATSLFASSYWSLDWSVKDNCGYMRSTLCVHVSSYEMEQTALPLSIASFMETTDLAGRALTVMCAASCAVYDEMRTSANRPMKIW